MGTGEVGTFEIFTDGMQPDSDLLIVTAVGAGKGWGGGGGTFLSWKSEGPTHTKTFLR